MPTWLAIFLILMAAGVGIGAGVYVQRLREKLVAKEAQRSSEEIVSEARGKADRLLKEAELKIKEQEIRNQERIEKEAKEQREKLSRIEERLEEKEDKVTRKMENLEKRDEEISRHKDRIAKKESLLDEKALKAEKLLEERNTQLEAVAQMTSEEARRMLMDQMIEDSKQQVAQHLKIMEEDARDMAEMKAKNIIAQTIQRYAGDYVAEKTVSVISLPNDEMKGRIIGREGRNIRAIEAATGIDLIIDDTPEAIILSGFNPIRREVARMALERLISDGRIHPTRIEEMVQKCEQELEDKIKDFGQQAAMDLGIHGLHPELLKLIGRLRWRTSYTQNVWEHSLEVAYMCGMMASELGISVKQARRAGLLHDIGKALTHEVDGSHALIGAQLAKKYGETPKIVHAIKAHHEEEKPETVLAVLVQAADSLSGARPGARKEILESYIKRLSDLENIARNFEGVEKSFAIQAGRELRVIVESHKISDADATMLSNEIAKKVEEDLTYPGQIKVVVIRETRATGIAH